MMHWCMVHWCLEPLHLLTTQCKETQLKVEVEMCNGTAAPPVTYGTFEVHNVQNVYCTFIFTQFIFWTVQSRAILTVPQLAKQIKARRS